MKKLNECPISPETHRRRPPYAAHIVERKGGKRSRPIPRKTRSRIEGARTGQVLEITNDEPLVAYDFSRDGPGQVDFDGARPDGVVIGAVGARSVVGFIELKSTGSDGKAEYGMGQVRAGVLHFAPFERLGGARSHGDEHHDAWTNGDDLPPVPLERDHLVLGVTIVFRQLPRDFEQYAPETIAGKLVTWALVHVHMTGMNEASIDLRKLLIDAQVPEVIDAPSRKRKK